MLIKAIFFDIDGTLVDSNEQHGSAWDNAFRRFGFMFEHQQIHDQIDKGADQLVPTLLPDADEAMVGRLGEAEAEVFEREYLQVVRPFAGARDLISRVLAGGKKVVLASSRPGLRSSTT